MCRPSSILSILHLLNGTRIGANFLHILGPVIKGNIVLPMPTCAEYIEEEYELTHNISVIRKPCVLQRKKERDTRVIYDRLYDLLYVVHIIALYVIYNADLQTEPMLSRTCGWLQKKDYITSANGKQWTQT